MRISRETIRELVSYGAAGVTTTLVNVGCYHLFLLFGLDYRLANAAALVLAKTYGYVVNKHFVFRSRCNSLKELAAEMGRYIWARGFTFAVDFFGLMALVEIAGIDKVIAKYVVQVVVIILNYLLGKMFVFGKAQGSKD